MHGIVEPPRRRLEKDDPGPGPPGHLPGGEPVEKQVSRVPKRDGGDVQDPADLPADPPPDVVSTEESRHCDAFPPHAVVCLNLTATPPPPAGRMQKENGRKGAKRTGRSRRSPGRLPPASVSSGTGSSPRPGTAASAPPRFRSGRSEERRVGKEGRSRWSP